MTIQKETPIVVSKRTTLERGFDPSDERKVESIPKLLVKKMLWFYAVGRAFRDKYYLSIL